MRPLASLVLLACVSLAAPVPKALKAKKDDAALIVGTWNGVALNGQPQPAGNYVFTFDADGGVNLKSGRGNGSAWTWTIDPAETPKRMKWVSAGNPASTWQCVYELDGDTLKIGFVPANRPIPAAVETTPGITLYEMTRDTSAK